MSTKSHGHLFWFHGHEIYERDGQVFRAPNTNVLVDGYRIGRWECSTEHLKRFGEVIFPREERT